MSPEFTAYFDDSGHPDDQAVVVVAGWVGNVEQWTLWEEGWKKVLSDFGIASGYFHMTEFEAAPRCGDADNVYKHLTSHERQIFLSRLINHIATRARCSFCCLVPMLDYVEVNSDYYLEEWLGKPYPVVSVSVCQKLRQWKERYAPNDTLEILFEDGTKHKGDLRKVFNQYKFDEPVFKDKRKVAPLQGADLLAWESFNAFNTGILRAPFMELLENTVGGGQHGMLTAPRLVEACNSVDPPVPMRDPAKPRAFYYTSEPKVRRLRAPNKTLRLPSTTKVRLIGLKPAGTRIASQTVGRGHEASRN
jgi:hypothetical protein